MSLVGCRVGLDLLSCERRTCHILAAGIPDHSSEIANQKHHLVPQFLELTHLIDDHGVPQVQIRSRRIETHFDPQRPVQRETLEQLLLNENLFDPPLELSEDVFKFILVVVCRHEQRILTEPLTLSPSRVRVTKGASINRRALASKIELLVAVFIGQFLPNIGHKQR